MIREVSNFTDLGEPGNILKIEEIYIWWIKKFLSQPHGANDLFTGRC